MLCKQCDSPLSYCGHFSFRKPSSIALASQCAESGTLNMAYRTLLQDMPLSADHRQQLHRRGLNDDQIKRGRYGTMPLRGRSAIAKHMVEQFGPELCSQVPGLIQLEQEDCLYWTLAGSPGLLIPVRSLNGDIVALKIRRDTNAVGSKYTTLTSARYGGPSPGSPAHIPLHDGIDCCELRVTEGELAADVSTALSGVVTIGLPGVAMGRKALPLLDTLQPKTVLIAFDADWRTNAHVAKALGALATSIRKAGFSLMMERWCPSQGKGIDDLLVNGHQPERLAWAACYAAMRRGMAIRNAPRMSDMIRRQMRENTCQR